MSTARLETFAGGVFATTMSISYDPRTRASVVGFGLIALFYVVASPLFGGRSPSSTISG